MQNRFKLFIAALGIAVLSGCASVPMDTPSADAALKSFPAPPADQAGLYIYRDSFAGQGLKKTVKIDGEVIGETANRTYFYRHISPGNHVLATESEFSDNAINLLAVAGQNYYVRQSIKMGVFVGGAKLDVVPEETAQKHLQKCELAK
ncbi:DUF2846 domain-containing protein [Pseudomonas leptonychotis]|jgi:hypothetical protein|uniref:DUF2846 domain-containing protein n=1 Tax=Pseudomonas leptonychotis TaxID=2448482 RepID=A0A4T2A0I7_9PSED|nr:DUF2846 domain-containing protein [Pseudomonas leptonychotis]TIH10490.1 DUF2846 domain-containing protein [Pseudomonas leptonychotis]|tara:strand:- start:65 stop:508 length:444 start_codon:yes stop_codon:yes gene_type:complete